MADLAAHTSVRALSLAVISEWATILALLFGGCCSNALTLEQLTRAHPQAGSLITFAQFVLISLHGLPKFLTTSRWHRIPIPRLRKRKIPIAPYLIQVGLFYGISLLNNMAFAYKIPMPVHIIFRSGGLVVSMVMGWAFAKKRYTRMQVASVLLVTAGVVLTTLSASNAKPKSAPSTTSVASTSQYAIGIAILSLALLLGGALGLAQDWTYSSYTRNLPAKPSTTGPLRSSANGTASKPVANGSAATSSRPAPDDNTDIQPWQESMFYLHFLSLPMFLFIRRDLSAQATALRASPPLRLSLPPSITPVLHPPFGLEKPLWTPSALSVELPSGYIPLALTTLTSLVCVAGVNRLTARVSSLTVTLVLVVRKAVSMLVSLVLFSQKGAEVDARMMWAGAACVFVGTMGYAAGSRGGKAGMKEKKEKKE